MSTYNIELERQERDWLMVAASSYRQQLLALGRQTQNWQARASVEGRAIDMLILIERLARLEPKLEDSEILERTTPEGLENDR